MYVFQSSGVRVRVRIVLPNWNHGWQHLKVKIPLTASQDTKATPTLNWKYRWQPHKVQRLRPLSPMKDIKQGAWTQICRQLADQNLKNWKSVVKGAHGHGQLVDQDGKYRKSTGHGRMHTVMCRSKIRNRQSSKTLGTQKGETMTK